MAKRKETGPHGGGTAALLLAQAILEPEWLRMIMINDYTCYAPSSQTVLPVRSNNMYESLIRSP